MAGDAKKPRFWQTCRMPEARETAPEQGTEAADEGEQKGEKRPEAEDASPGKPEEIGGPRGPEPTRFGDWERAGRCIDF